jgi:hypothetical protein
MNVENEFFPVIAGELGTSVETVKQYERRLDEFSPVFQVNKIIICVIFLTFQSIDNCMKIEKDFFFPNIGGYLGNSSATAEEMQRKCQEFKKSFSIFIQLSID